MRLSTLKVILTDGEKMAVLKAIFIRHGGNHWPIFLDLLFYFISVLLDKSALCSGHAVFYHLGLIFLLLLFKNASSFWHFIQSKLHISEKMVSLFLLEKGQISEEMSATCTKAMSRLIFLKLSGDVSVKSELRVPVCSQLFWMCIGITYLLKSIAFSSDLFWSSQRAVLEDHQEACTKCSRLSLCHKCHWYGPVGRVHC